VRIAARRRAREGAAPRELRRRHSGPLRQSLLLIPAPSTPKLSQRPLQTQTGRKSGGLKPPLLDGIADPGGISEDTYRQVHDGSGKCSSTLGKKNSRTLPGRCEPTPRTFQGFCVPLPALPRASHAPEPMAGLAAALWAKTAPAASAGSAGHVGSRLVDRSRTLSTAERHRIGR
jgi:hypothetical protein